MSTKLKEKEEKIQQIIAKLIEQSTNGKLIVVEGKKDKIALEGLGLRGKILTVKTGGKSFQQTTEEIEKAGAAEVVLLLDFDRRGKEGTLRLKQNLERAKIKVNMRFWLDLHALVSRDVACIESLPSYLHTLQERIN